jgi:hypothetical protein
MKTKMVYADCSGGAVIEVVSTYFTRSATKETVRTKCVLARVVIDREYDQPNKYIEEALKIFKLFQNLYSNHEDQDVGIFLTVEDYCVNL